MYHHVTNLYHWQELSGAQVYLPIQTCTPSVSMPMEDPHENRQRTHLNIDIHRPILTRKELPHRLHVDISKTTLKKTTKSCK